MENGGNFKFLKQNFGFWLRFWRIWNPIKKGKKYLDFENLKLKNIFIVSSPVFIERYIYL